LTLSLELLDALDVAEETLRNSQVVHDLLGHLSGPDNSTDGVADIGGLGWFFHAGDGFETLASTALKFFPVLLHLLRKLCLQVFTLALQLLLDSFLGEETLPALELAEELARSGFTVLEDLLAEFLTDFFLHGF